MTPSSLPLERKSLIAQLCLARAELLQALIGLDEAALAGAPLAGHWTVKDLLAHIAVWDRWDLAAMQALLAGRRPDLAATADLDAFNLASAAAWQPRSLAEVVTELEAARNDWLAWLATVPGEAFFQPRSLDGEDWSFPACINLQRRHDVEHGEQIRAWREAAGPALRPGPKAALLAGMRAARVALLAVADLVPEAQRTTRPLTGAWTLQDVLGHIADWEWWGADGLRQMAAGREPQVEGFSSIQAWNEAHATARQGQPWQQAWTDFNAARQALDAALAGMDQVGLERRYYAAWANAERPAYAWAVIFLEHDLEHAQELFQALL